MRQKGHTADRIIATFRKNRTDDKYLECIHLAKGVEWSRIELSEQYSSCPLPVTKEETTENIA